MSKLRWSKSRIYWCVVDEVGRASIPSCRWNKTNAIKAFVADADKTDDPWNWPHWYRRGYRCVRVEVQVRAALCGGEGVNE